MSFVAFRATGRSWFACAALATAVACGGGTTGPSIPTLLVVKSGGGQSGSVGSPLTARVVVEARDSKGPIANVLIAVAVEQTGGGSVSPQSATTAADGTAQFTWTLGSKVGVQTLTFATTGATPVNTTTTATASAGAASIILPNSEIFQLVVVGHTVSSLPSVTVTDNFSNPIAGTQVSFEALSGGNTLGGTSQTTNAAGVATIGSWVIGNEALNYSIRARIENGAVAVFEAKGIPATMTAVAGAAQTANAGTAVPVLPAVRAARDDGSPLSNVVINFTVTSGGGVVTGGTVVTAADGTARPAQWVLGTVAGLNRLEASTLGRPSVNFDATGTPAVPAIAVATGGTALSGSFGNYLAGVPEVTVRDAGGNPVAAVPVTFQVGQGGGQVSGGTTQTDFLGRASLKSWRLGAAGAQTVTATAGSLAPVVFTAAASAPPAGSFKIEVRYPNTQPSPEQKAAFDLAAARWKELILAGGAPYLIFEVAPGCPDITGETVDGVVIFADLKAIDGVNGVLGSAGPCIMRDDGFLPAEGIMQFDTADLPALQASGQFNLVILHEMAHVLGFGTIWNLDAGPLGSNAFLSGFPGSDPTFNGPGTRAAFFGSISQGTFGGVPVPVEGGFGPGTRYSHWRELTFVNELMTGFLDPGSNPLSAITVQQFRDLGYTVNDAVADPYSFQAAILAAGAPAGLQLVEGVLPGPMIVINRQGRAVARVARTFR